MKKGQPNYWNLYVKKNDFKFYEDNIFLNNDGIIQINKDMRVHNSVAVSNQDNTANVALNWSPNGVARIRVGGSAPGSTNGFEVQSPGDTIEFRIGSGATYTRGCTPLTGGTYNLGNAVARWKDIYMSGHIYIDCNAGEKQVTFYDGTTKACYLYGQKIGRIGMYDSINNRGVFYYDWNGGTPSIFLQNHTRPQTNNAYDMGTSTYRWRTVYATNALNTSDRDYKDNIEYISNDVNTLNTDESFTYKDMYDFYKDIDLATYNYKGQENKEFGFIAQDIVDNKVGNTIAIPSEEGYMYSTGSYISSIAGALKQAINEIETLKQEILALKGEI